MIPAGKHQLYLQWQTEDRANLSGVIFTVGSQTVHADTYGRAKVMVDSGEAVTISVSHSGTYSGDGPQTVDTPSAEQSFVYFYGSRVSALDAYPVGSIYMSVNATNPSTILGGGTWERIAQGRTLIGEGTSDQTFSAGKTGGESRHTLMLEEMPLHSHSVTPKGSVSLSLDSGSFESLSNYISDVKYGSLCDASGIVSLDGVKKNYGASQPGGFRTYDSHTAATIQPTGTATFTGSPSSSTYQGGGSSHNNLPPYLVCYIWQRTA